MEKTAENSAERLHGCLLDLALEIQRICEKNRISYFLVAGSLLGAVRHKGIIPWDDDMDIGMLRADYEKFIKICPREVQACYELITPESVAGYGQTYAKLMIKNTKFFEPGIPSGVPCGIFLDIFPIDRIPDSFFDRFLQARITGSMRAVLRIKCGYQFQWNGIKDRLYFFVSKVFSKQYIMRIISHWQKKYNTKETSYYANLCGVYPYGKEAFPKYTLEGQLKKVPYDGCEFPIPNSPSEILTRLYGDYMVPPPEDKRVFRHLGGEIDYGDYVCVCFAQK